MIVVALVGSLLLIALAAVIRAGTTSLVRVPRADALRADNDGIDGAAQVAELLEDRTNLQAPLGTTVTFLTVIAVIPFTWALTDSLSGPPLAIALVAMAIAASVQP